MKAGGSGLLILAIGLLVIYLAITGRYKCLAGFIACIGGADCNCADKETDKITSKVVTPLTPIQPIKPVFSQ